MKKCFCRCFTDNPILRELLLNDLRDLGLAPQATATQVYVEFNENALIQPVIDLFSEFENYGYYVEF